MSQLTFPLVVADTATMSHEEWLHARHCGIGGSDAAAVLNVSPWTSPRALWQTKTATSPRITKSSPAMEFGHKMEPVIADWFNEEFGMELVNDTHLYAHPEHPFMLANLDRRIGEEAVIEIKTSRREWNEVPPYYVAQIQHYMAVTNLPIAYCVALFNGEFPPRVFKVPRDDQYIARLIDAETDFWQMVVKHAAPVVDGHEATHSALRSAYEPEQNKTVELGDELTKLIVERASAKANIERYEEVVRQCEARIMELMGDAETATVNGTKMVTWKQQNRTSVDSKALSQKYPQLAEEFEKRSTFRVLKITTPKE